MHVNILHMRCSLAQCTESVLDIRDVLHLDNLCALLNVADLMLSVHSRSLLTNNRTLKLRATLLWSDSSGNCDANGTG